MIITTLKQEDPSVRRGRQIAAHSRITICSTVRDCDSRLKSNIPKIEALRKLFRSSSVVIIENDSKDNTKEVLTRWRHEAENVTLLMKDFHVNTFKPTNSDVLPAYSKHRIERMSLYRNMYMDVLANQPSDYVIVIDLDLLDFSIPGILHSLGHRDEWDTITANGICASPLKHFYKGNVYYDTFAYMEHGDTRPRNVRMLMAYQKQLKSIGQQDGLIKIESAFGGLALYRYEALMSARYSAQENKEKQIEALCEHISLHRQMATAGFDKIFINPKMVAVYESFLSRMHKLIARR